MRAFLAVAAVAALCMTALPASSLTLRDENRQRLLMEEGVWNPASTVLVTRTVGTQVQVLQATKAAALEMELDYLDAAGIRLADFPAGGSTVAPTGGPNPQPSWPALGTFTVREWGFHSVGARCPTVLLNAPVDVVGAYNQLRGTNAVGLNMYESSISEHWQKSNPDGSTTEYGSQMSHQPIDGSPAPPAYKYGRDAPGTPEGWTLRFAFEASVAPGGTFFCKEETLAANGVDRVRLTGKFTPFADRIDD